MYLCPLDLADTLPEMRFGEANIARFNGALLRELFNDSKLMAHMTAIEASVGLRSDFPTPGQPKPPAGSSRPKQMGAKRRVVLRITALLRDTQAGSDYAKLYELRSAFVHGRPILEMISSANRNLARSLARRIVVALVDAANATPAPTSREGFLGELA